MQAKGNEISNSFLDAKLNRVVPPRVPFYRNICLSDGDDLLRCLYITLWCDFWGGLPGHLQLDSTYYSRAFGDGPRHFESWSSDELDPPGPGQGGTPNSYLTTAMGEHLSSRQI
ncbi:hypothetical protein TNCV_1540751 [Trichonephila clavipes]|nr:hypothetical protein TNCV_1540751 [Trichonephila clavipes]